MFAISSAFALIALLLHFRATALAFLIIEAATSAVFLAWASVYLMAAYEDALTKLIAFPASFFTVMTFFNALILSAFILAASSKA